MTNPIVLMSFDFPITDANRRAVADAWPGADFRRTICETQEQLDAVDGRNVVALLTESVPRTLSSAWRDLKFVQLASAGSDHLKDHPIWSSGIPVATATGIHSVPMAQFATGMLLAMVHRFADIREFQQSRRWIAREALQGTVIRGWTAGIVGYGSIGRECARQLNQLGLRIVAMKRDPSARAQVDPFAPWPGTGDPEGQLPERWFAPHQIDEMLPLCDVLVVAAPRTPETLGLIRAAQLARMKPTARIIIISRGAIVDERDLADALREKRLAGAAVDCFLPEPPASDHPLFDAPNCILTPHMSGVYEGYADTLNQLLCENLRRLSRGQPPKNLVRR
jgi:phosphoglycerate dehydrogenase-like enzyme